MQTEAELMMSEHKLNEGFCQSCVNGSRFNAIKTESLEMKRLHAPTGSSSGPGE